MRDDLYPVGQGRYGQFAGLGSTGWLRRGLIASRQRKRRYFYMIVTIDGPAGAGKSTVARRLAERIGFQFLDTGAMYRAVALAALRCQIDFSDGKQLAELVRRVTIQFDGRRVLLDGEDVTQAIRANGVSVNVRPVADNAAVRQHLISLQRQLAANRDVVTEGRDQGTLAFPEAQCKIFLTASPEERARRRTAELLARGEVVAMEEVLKQQTVRDEQDSKRPFGALSAAPDAIRVNTERLTQDEVVARLERIVRDCTN